MRFNKARLSTGLRIHYAESGDARGTPVVFVHGWPDSWFSFSRVLSLLPETLRLIALDQRGFGESDHPDSGYTIPGFAADLVAMLDALDIERAVLDEDHRRGRPSSRAARAAGSHSRVVRARVPVRYGVSPSARRVLRPHHRGELEDSATPLARHDRLPAGLRRHARGRQDSRADAVTVGRSRRAVFARPARRLPRNPTCGAAQGLPGNGSLPELGASRMGRSRHCRLRRGRGSRLAAVGSRLPNSVRSQASTRPNIRMEPTRRLSRGFMSPRRAAHSVR